MAQKEADGSEYGTTVATVTVTITNDDMELINFLSL